MRVSAAISAAVSCVNWTQSMKTRGWCSNSPAHNSTGSISRPLGHQPLQASPILQPITWTGTATRITTATAKGSCTDINWRTNVVFEARPARTILVHFACPAPTTCSMLPWLSRWLNPWTPRSMGQHCRHFAACHTACAHWAIHTRPASLMTRSQQHPKPLSWPLRPFLNPLAFISLPADMTRASRSHRFQRSATRLRGCTPLAIPAK